MTNSNSPGEDFVLAAEEWWQSHVNMAQLLRLVSGCNYVAALLKPVLMLCGIRLLYYWGSVERVTLGRMMP